MKKLCLMLAIYSYHSIALAQPDIRQLLLLSDSLVQIAVALPNGNTGNGSGGCGE